MRRHTSNTADASRLPKRHKWAAAYGKKATAVLIIEDEVLMAIDLEALVMSIGHRVIGMARTHAEGHPPGSHKATL
jgi:hypothetical protein